MINKIVTAAVFASFAAFVGNSPHSSAAPAPTIVPTSPIRICVLLPSQREERWKRDRSAFLEEKTKRKNIILDIMVSDNDANAQASQIDLSLANGCGALILAAHDHLQMARKLASIPPRYPPIVVYDRFVASDRVSLYVSYNPRSIGRMQGEFLARKAPNGHFLLLRGPATDDNARIYFEAAQAALAPLFQRGDAVLVQEREVADWNPALAQLATRQAWEKSSAKLNAVLAPNDALAGGVIEMLRILGVRKKVWISGQDADAAALKRLAGGTQSMTVAKPIAPLAKAALDAALSLAHGEKADTSLSWTAAGVTVPALLLEPEVLEGH